MNRHRSLIRPALLALLTAALTGGCVSLLLERGWPRAAGTLSGLPLSAPVTIRRDAFGIPHIFAANQKDLFFAQGYVHAQDRLFQMEMVRRLVGGTLSEILGRRALDTDHFAHLAGFPELRRRISVDLSGRDRELLAAYTAGINSFLTAEDRDLPLECRLLRLRPRPWSVEEALSNFVLFSWGLAVNYAQELLALRVGAGLPLALWNELFPACPGASLPPDRYFEDLRRLDTGRLLPAAGAFLVPSVPPGSGGGSNAWAVAAGAGGRPILANDPHLAVAVPQFWYFCRLRAPGFDAAGASVAGTPGILIGRNPDLAWGLTNLMADYVDLFVVRLDPEDPHRYIVNGRSLSMREETLNIPLRRRSAARSVWHTCFGPVISSLRPKAEAAVVLKWYGTLPAGRLHDNSPGAVLAINRAESVDEALDAGAGVSLLGLNLVVADGSGHIGWRALGAPPLRRGYSGRLPADGSRGGMDWDGFLSPEALPRLQDPPEGRLASANQRLPSVEGSDLSHSWCSPYRYRRIDDVLSGLTEPTTEDFLRLQLDVLSLQADRLLPSILACDFRDPKAREAAELLAGWDRSIRADSGAAALWELFVNAWLRLLVEDDLGEDTAAYLDLSAVFHSLQDEILTRPASPLWDRRDTRRRESSRDILEMALVRALAELKEGLGANPEDWRWGALHAHAYEHPGASLGLLTRHLNRGAYPADGDNDTVQATGFLPGRNGYQVVWHPSMRMIAPLGEDFLLVAGPMGQSGQPGHRHYDDMIGPWQRGEMIRLALDEDESAAGGPDLSAGGELLLVP